MTNSLKICFFCILCLLFSSVYGQDQERVIEGIFPIKYVSQDIEHFTLENGLQIFSIHMNNTLQTATHIVLYHVASKDDPKGLSGLSYLLHNMSKCKTEYGNINSMLNRISTVHGSYVSTHETSFYALTPVDNLPEIMHLEASRMNNIIFSDSRLEIEKKRVQEMLIAQNDPSSTLMNSMLSLYFMGSTHWNILGLLEDIDTITIDDTYEIYNTYYSPQNAKLIIISNLDHQDVFNMANTYYGAIENSTILNKKEYSHYVTPASSLKLDMMIDSGPEMIKFIYQTPKITQETLFAYLIMYNILFTGDNSIFNRILHSQKHLVHSIESDFSSVLENGYLYINIIPYPNTSTENVILEIKKIINQLLSNGFSVEDIQQAISAFSLSFVEDNIGLINKSKLYARLIDLKLESLSDYTSTTNIIYNMTASDINTAFYQIFSNGPKIQGRLKKDIN